MLDGSFAPIKQFAGHTTSDTPPSSEYIVATRTVLKNLSDSDFEVTFSHNGQSLTQHIPAESEVCVFNLFKDKIMNSPLVVKGLEDGLFVATERKHLLFADSRGIY